MTEPETYVELVEAAKEASAAWEAWDYFEMVGKSVIAPTRLCNAMDRLRDLVEKASGI